MQGTATRTSKSSQNGLSNGNGNGNGTVAASKPSRRHAGNAPDARMRRILIAISAFRDGDFSVRLPVGWDGTEGMIAGAFNQLISQKQRISGEIMRLSQTVGKEGRLKQRMNLPGAVGDW